MDLYEQSGQGLYGNSQQPQRPSRRQLRMANIVGAIADGTAAQRGNPVQGLGFSMPQGLIDSYEQKIALQQQARHGMERQADQDALNKQNIESQIQKRNHEMSGGGGGFEGTGIEAQMLNIALDPTIPENDPRKIMAKQRLQRSITTVTPQGTYTNPGYDLEAINPYQSAEPPVPAGYTSKKLTDTERKAGGYYNRMIGAQIEIDELGDYNPVSASETSMGATNVTSTPNKQRYRQAANDWIRAKLRHESGAVIADDEMESEYRTYFPIFGDSPEVIEQKSRARALAERGMAEAGGIKLEKDTTDLRSKYGLNK